MKTSNPEYLDPRWQKLRLRAFERDGWACQACRSTTKTLVAHHKRYNGGPVWSSPLSDIQTLCAECHEALGPHPKGGVWWEDDEEHLPCFIHEHCPLCGSTAVGRGPKYGKLQTCECGQVLVWRRPLHLFSQHPHHYAILLSRLKRLRAAFTGEPVRILEQPADPGRFGFVAACPSCGGDGQATDCPECVFVGVDVDVGPVMGLADPIGLLEAWAQEDRKTDPV